MHLGVAGAGVRGTEAGLRPAGVDVTRAQLAGVLVQPADRVAERGGLQLDATARDVRPGDRVVEAAAAGTGPVAQLRRGQGRRVGRVEGLVAVCVEGTDVDRVRGHAEQHAAGHEDRDQGGYRAPVSSGTPPQPGQPRHGAAACAVMVGLLLRRLARAANGVANRNVYVTVT